MFIDFPLVCCAFVRLCDGVHDVVSLAIPLWFMLFVCLFGRMLFFVCLIVCLFCLCIARFCVCVIACLFDFYSV